MMLFMLISKIGAYHHFFVLIFFVDALETVSYTHLTLPTIYSV